MRWERAADSPRDETGAVTVEFAIGLTVVLAVLGLMIGGILLAAHRIGLSATAADIARLEARGDSATAKERLAQAGQEIAVRRRQAGAILCVELLSRPGRGPLAAIEVTAEACAAMSEAGAK